MHARILTFNTVILLVQRSADGLHVSLHQKPEPETPITIGDDTTTWRAFSPSHSPRGFEVSSHITLPDPLAAWTHLTDADLSLHAQTPKKLFRNGIDRLLPDPRPLHPQVSVGTAAEIHVIASAGDLSAPMRGVLLSCADEYNLHGRLEGGSQFIPHGPLHPDLQGIWDAWSARETVTFTATHPPVPIDNFPRYQRLSGKPGRVTDIRTGATLTDTKVIVRNRSPQKVIIQGVQYNPQRPEQIEGVGDTSRAFISGRTELNVPQNVTFPDGTHTVHLSVPGTEQRSFAELYVPPYGRQDTSDHHTLTQASSFHLRKLNFPASHAQVRPATPEELAALKEPLQRPGHHPAQPVLSAFDEPVGVNVRLHPTIPGLLSVQSETPSASPITVQGGLYHTIMRSAKGDVYLHASNPVGPWYMEPAHVRSDYFTYPDVTGLLDQSALGILERQLTAHQDATVTYHVNGNALHLTIGGVTRILPRTSPLAQVLSGHLHLRVATRDTDGQDGPPRWVNATAEGLQAEAYLRLRNAQDQPLHISGHPMILPADELSPDAPTWQAGDGDHQALDALVNYQHALWAHAQPGGDRHFPDGTLLRTQVTPAGLIVTAHGHPDGPADATYTGVPGVAGLSHLSLNLRAALWPPGLQAWAARHTGSAQGRAAVRDLLSLHGQFPTHLNAGA